MSTPETLSADQAVARAVALAAAGGRSVLGIAGAPGAGKSTLARRVVTAVTEQLGAGVAVQVQMDGFHLANAALDALGRHDRKGAIDTFDAAGYVALVRRLTGGHGHRQHRPHRHDLGPGLRPPCRRARRRQHRRPTGDRARRLRGQLPARPEHALVRAAGALHRDLGLRGRRRRPRRPPRRSTHAPRPRPRVRPGLGCGRGRRQRRTGRSGPAAGRRPGPDVASDHAHHRATPGPPTDRSTT
ncbi:ATP-binding protein [Curtobacterium sp. MCPF17_052]|uniref:ATP-binding protein n=1 Tax=Curtobacterium sp. MCPF17_052 TaxID=2175655 RepID=UPI0024DFE54C|nr:ATP-binding protein [Curtobacterium sp. MCPF17_052]WIB11389.1 ATP-binding protein [Curtobacterium sp. MCPF17_052]